MVKKFLSCLCAPIMLVGSANCAGKDVAARIPGQTSIEYKINDELKENANFMFSPFSLKSAFMLAINGCEGKSQKEMLKVFGIDDLNQYNLKMRDINKSLNDSKAVNISNSVWINKSQAGKNVEFNQIYLKNIRKNFNANAYTVTNADAVESINSYVRNKTNGKIKEIINSPDFLSVLINTIYFKSDWEKPFLKENTYEEKFFNRNGTTPKVKFMHNKGKFNYFENSKMQLLEMKYKDSNLSMYVALPRNDEALTEEDIQYGIKNKSYEDVMISMPKFKTESSFDLSETMKKLGIREAFSERCKDFGNVMFNGCDAYISKVIQKTFIEVDEKGTEAAAATAIVMDNRCCVEHPKMPKIFKADHPFTYMIKDNVSGEILFMGQQLEF